MLHNFAQKQSFMFLKCSVFPKLECESESLGRHVKTQITGSHAQFPNSVGLGGAENLHLKVPEDYLPLLLVHILQTTALKYHPFKIFESSGFSLYKPSILREIITVNTESPREQKSVLSDWLGRQTG